MGLIRTIPPAAEPISLTEAKLHLKQEDTADDTLITRLCRAARWHAESFTGRQLVAATFEYRCNNLRAMELLPAPLLSIASITYVDLDSATQTVSTSVYTVDIERFVGRVHLAYNQEWPTCRGYTNDVTVTFVAGHATPFTANATSDVCTWFGRQPTDADSYILSNSGGASGALPAGLTTNTLHYVVTASAATCQFALTSGGSAIDITDTGTGTHFVGEVPEPIREAMLLLIGHWYVNREEVVLGTVANRLPEAATALLWGERVKGF